MIKLDYFIESFLIRKMLKRNIRRKTKRNDEQSFFVT